MDDFSDDGELQLDTHIHIHTANIHMPGFFQVRDNKDETYKTGQREECVHSSWVHSFRIKMEFKKKRRNSVLGQNGVSFTACTLSHPQMCPVHLQRFKKS